ncbi:MAG: immune inhibitor A domain-containing protein [Nocardioidaceae bacterium]
MTYRSLSKMQIGGVAGTVTLSLGLVVTLGPASASAQSQAQAPGDGASPIVPVDEQVWKEQSDMTWDDYVPIRPKNWNSAATSQGSEVQYRTAVILVDFRDQPFLITEEPEAHPFGNPQSGWEPVPQSGVNDWFDDYYTVPNQYNGRQTLHSYWMEDSHGRIGVDVEVFGPYTMPHNWWQYGLSEWDATSIETNMCPAQSDIPTGGTNVTELNVETTDFFYEGDRVAIRHDMFPPGPNRPPVTINRRVVDIPNDHTLTLDEPVERILDGARVHDCALDIRSDGGAAWRADIGCEQGLCGFDNGFYVTAGHDESSTWQEFGEMQWEQPEQVPDEFGNPNPALPNSSVTRYVPWTSWMAAANHWPNAGGGTSTQAESSGQSVFAHEFSHLRGLPDNYNNPFADNDRNYTGYWEMMSRGTFNGPGGTHNRWQIPNAGGSALGPHHMLHFKTTGNNRLGVVRDTEQVVLERNDLPSQGIAVTTLKAREYVPNGDKVGLTVNLGAGGYTPGNCQTRTSEPFWCTHTNETTWQRFTMEVVDRVGNDSFTAGHGVLIAQARNTGSPRVQLIDANIDNIDRIDFYRPDGTPVAVVRGDPRQLDDGTFHAGTNSGSLYEYVDTFNKLHFYVLDTHRDKNGVLFYDVAVRNLDGAGNFQRDVDVRATSTRPVGGGTTLIRTRLANTGQAGEGIFNSDVYRLSATVDGEGWTTHLPYAVRAIAAGEALTTPVYATAGDGASESATVTITATSESDPSATQSITVSLGSDDLAVTYDSARSLVTDYAADGILTGPQADNLRGLLDGAEDADPPGAERVLDNFSNRVNGVSDPLAKAALLSVAEALRAQL